ncbi:MAG: FISUMP domain-containing protein [Candidatus Paceibacterota bacterium]|nr:hypothetical protein [Bacteroidales bacterium]
MQKDKIKKILLSGIFILSLFFIIPGIADAESACADKLSGLNRYLSCQVLTGDTLVINAEACTNACFKITNTSGKSVFIPTNTCAEWDAFLAHMPSGMATSSCITYPTISVSNTTKTYGDASFTITHSTNSAGAKTFSSSNTAVATITNAGVVTIVAGGTSTITFNTAATEDHYAGTATATLTVNKGDQATPAAPTMSSRTTTSIILNACSGGGCEYRIGSGSWQTSTTFSGLTANTSYSFTQRKAATTNYNVSAESSAASFSTIDPCNGETTATLYGTSYPIKTLGPQCWMTRNLNYATASSWCPGNSSTNCNIYGRMYDWTAAKTVCPSGWHLPSDAEFYILTNTIGSSKDAWTNASGFNGGQYGGYLYPSIGFQQIGQSSYWWSSTSSVDGSLSRYLYYLSPNVNRTAYSPSLAIGVRCLRN